MKRICAISLVLILSLHCTKNDVNKPTYQITERITYLELIDALPMQRLDQAVEKPDSSGALGRNKQGYFHVRFQLGMTSISDFAIVNQRIDALDQFIQTLDYAFDHQTSRGDFFLVIPEELQNLADQLNFSDADLASGVAFFSSSLGISLLSLLKSDWFMNSESTQTHREALELYRGNIESLLDYLISIEGTLEQYDEKAPNRLLFNALAYTGLGFYSGNTNALRIANKFFGIALEQVEYSDGYFIENGGYDSSYNGVALKLAIELWSMVNYGNRNDDLENAIIRAANWQISRIKSNGEILTDGNTRVYPGGESFLGNEKGVDYAKTVRALYYLSSIFKDPTLIDMGDQVLEFYQ